MSDADSLFGYEIEYKQVGPEKLKWWQLFDSQRDNAWRAQAFTAGQVFYEYGATAESAVRKLQHQVDIYRGYDQAQTIRVEEGPNLQEGQQ